MFRPRCRFVPLLIACAFALLLPEASAAGSAGPLSAESDVRLGPGDTHQVTFELPSARRVVLFIRARANPSEADARTAPAYFSRNDSGAPDLLGVYGLGLERDGRPLTPESVRVLRQDRMILRGEEDETVSLPLYEPESGRWLVKGDRRYGVTPGRFAALPWVKHYYQHAFDLGELEAGSHSITLRAQWPDQAGVDFLHVRDVNVYPAPRSALITSADWMKLAFGWQPPAPEELADGALQMQACAGEYEPVGFGVYSLDGLEDVEIVMSDIRKGDLEIPASNASIFRVEALKRGSLGEAGFLARMPFVPEKWRRRSPELLIPQTEGPADIAPAHLQRYYVDVELPQGLEPGVYRGGVQVRAGGRTVRELPLDLRVLPFDLAESRSKYWMWRLTWSPLWQPENVARLRDIVQHGFAGLARMCGAAFKFTITEEGEVQVDDSNYRKAVAAMERAGMELQVADDHLANTLLQTIAGHLDLKIENVTRNLPRLEEYLRERARNETATAEARDDLIERLDDGQEDGDDGGDLPDDLAEAGNKELDEALEAASRRAGRLQEEIRALAIEGFRKVGAKAREMDLKFYVFPIDEPDGTPWKRRWTTYAAGLAKEAGLETWSTRNAVDWQGHIDHKAFGGKINQMYRQPSVVSDRYEGRLRIDPLPMIGAFRGGAKYHFDGEIDEVRIYNRALTGEELRSQYRSPAEDGLLARYDFDEPISGGRVKDASGNGHDLQLVGTPEQVEGRLGHAMKFNGQDEHLVPVEGAGARQSIDLSRGYTISLWYRGKGPMFGAGYDFYPQGGGKLRFTTTEQKRRWFGHSGFQSRRFWQHLTYSFDPKTRTVSAYVQNPDMREWYRRNIGWNYVQIRSMPPKNPRYKTGIMAWYYANLGRLTNMTTFCYDWNANHLYVAYPKNGDRFNEEGVWYRTLGWEGTREGIDDARYLQTLTEMLMEREDVDRIEAVRRVRGLIEEVGVGYEINQVIRRMGGYASMRRRVIERILELR